MKILLLANRPSANSQAITVTEYLDAFRTFSGHQVYEISMMGEFPSKINLNRFDAILLHYSLSIGPLINHYLGPELIEKLKNYNGLKAAFLQDEYREIKTYWKHIQELNLHLLLSCVPESEITKVYPPETLPGVTVVNVLTGYVSNHLLNLETKPVKDRPIEVGYRSRKPPFWLGRLGWDKHWIAGEFSRRAKNYKLRTDISVNEGDRLYGNAWTNFIGACRALLGTESGASIIDFDGKLERQVDEYVAKHPQTDFEIVFELFLKQHEGSLHLHQISPRCFEAAALRTPMVLFEGEYSGILKPHQHYIPLKKDFSNMDEVVCKIRDTDGLQKMADRTYKEVAQNPEFHYSEFMKRVDRALEEKFESLNLSANSVEYPFAEFQSDLKASFKYFFKRKMVLALQSLMLGFPWARKALFGLWFRLPLSVQRIIRPVTWIISR